MVLLLQQLQYCPRVDMAPPASSRRLRTLRQSRQVYTLMHWSLTADDYTDNIDSGQDPMRGARVCASYVDPLGSLGGTVQDSEDEEEPAQQPGKRSISAFM